MSYEIKKWKFEDARMQIQDCEFALIYMISELIFTRVEILSEINWRECVEARFFSEDKELHFFHIDGEWKIVQVSDKDEKDTIIKKYELANKFRNLGKNVLVKEYIAYDKDGQANVTLTRLMGIER